MKSFYYYLAILLTLVGYWQRKIYVIIIFLCLFLYILSLVSQKFGRKEMLRVLLIPCIVVLFVIRFEQHVQYQNNSSIYNKEYIVYQVKDTKTGQQLFVQSKGILFFKQKLLVYTKDNDVRIHRGDILKISCQGTPIPQPKTLGVFNYGRYQASKGIFHQCFQADVKIETSSSSVILRILQVILQVQQSIYDYIETFDEHIRPFQQAFILADSSGLKESQEILFTLGISHLFLQSNFYLQKLKRFVLKINIQLKLTVETVEFICNTCIILYYLLISFHAPFGITRGVFSSCIVPYIFKKKRRDVMGRLQLHVIIHVFFLALNPFLMYQLGFIYGNILMVFHIIYGKNLSKNKQKLTHKFSQLLMPCLLLLPFQLLLDGGVDFLIVLIQLLFTMVTPFLYYICLIMFIIPSSTMLFKEVFFQLHQVLSTLQPVSQKIPIIFIFTIESIFIFFLILYFIEQCVHKKRRVFAIVQVITFMMAIHTFNVNIDSIHFLQLPDGEAIVIKYQQQVYMIDVGGTIKESSNEYAVQQYILPFLTRIGIQKIDHLIITHDDADHIGNLLALSKEISISNLYLNVKSRETFQEELYTIDTIHTVDQEVNLNPLHIFPDLIPESDNNNNHSLVVYARLANKGFLLTGDLEKDGESVFIKLYKALPKIDYLKVGHHGSRTSSSVNFLNKVQPSYAIIMVQMNNRFNHPHEETIQHLKRFKVKISNTNDDGSQHYFFYGQLPVIWKY